MFFISLFSYFSLSIFASIDLGAQYVRISLSSIKEPVSMALNEHNKLLTPSAIAFKLPKYSEKHMTLDEASKCEIKIGEDAVRFLKHKKMAGNQFIPRVVGRTHSTEYEIPAILNTTEMLAVFLKKILLQTQYSALEIFSLTIPNYYTLSQRECIIEAVNISQLPFFGLIDDTSAIIQLYTIMFSKRFIYESHGVLFIDIGASAVRAYRIVFTQNETDPLGTQTSYEWTEKTGGLEFVRKVARHENISMSKAQKLLINGNRDYKHLFDDDLEIIYNIVQVAIDGEVDEVQLIGGASRFPFIIEYIKSIVGYTDVLRDLPQTDSIALGSLHIVQATLNQSRYKLIPVVKPPFYTSIVKCGGYEAEYCKLHNECKNHIVIEGTICKTVSIIARSEVPEGSSKTLGQFDMKNISDFPREIDDPMSGFLVMQPPAPYVISAMWCKTGKRFCCPINVVPTENEDPLKRRKAAFVDAIIQADSDRRKKAEFRARLALIVDRAKSYISSEDNVAMEQKDDEITQMLEMANQISEGQFDLSVPDMRIFLIKLEKKVKQLQIGLD